MPAWAVTLLLTVALPSIKKLAVFLEQQADTTPEEWDDVAAGAFRTVVEFLESGRLETLVK